MPPLPPTIASRTNARVKLLRTAFSGKAGRAGELVGVEGWKSVLQACEAGLRFASLGLTEVGAQQYTPERARQLCPDEVLVLSEGVMASVTDTVTAPEVIGIVEIPDRGRTGPRSGVFLLLETIQDPGNVGTLIRSAEAFGVERVVLSPGCANPWSPKAIRSSAGSIFRQALRREPLGAALDELQDLGVRSLAAVARSEGACSSFEGTFVAPVAVIIGNEGSGLSEELLSRVQEKVYVPCFTESLNAAVAGSLLLYEVASRRVRGFAGAQHHHHGPPAKSGAHGTL